MTSFINMVTTFLRIDLDDISLVWWLLAAIFVIAQAIIVCGKFARAAQEKGDPDTAIGVKCLFFGIPYMLAVIAMPDRGSKQESSVMDPNHGLEKWQCPNCKKLNNNSVGVCACGTANRPEINRSK